MADMTVFPKVKSYLFAGMKKHWVQIVAEADIPAYGEAEHWKMFNKNLPIVFRAAAGRTRPRDLLLDAGRAESDKAAMKTPFAICGICIIG